MCWYHSRATHAQPYCTQILRSETAFFVAKVALVIPSLPFDSLSPLSADRIQRFSSTNTSLNWSSNQREIDLYQFQICWKCAGLPGIRWSCPLVSCYKPPVIWSFLLTSERTALVLVPKVPSSAEEASASSRLYLSQSVVFPAQDLLDEAPPKGNLSWY